MIVNGQRIDLVKEISLIDFLKNAGYNTERVAVEKNGGIVPKKFFDTEMLADGDKVEIVHFVGGG